MSQAMNLTPIGATTFAPTVDTTVFQSDIASASSPKTATSGIGFEGATTAFSSGSYILDGSNNSGFLHGSIYLVGIVNGSESGDGEYLGTGSVAASVDEFFVLAVYDDNSELWDVTVNLPGITDSFSTAGVNNFFTFTIPVSLPMTVNLEATSGTAARARAFPVMNDNA